MANGLAQFWLLAAPDGHARNFSVFIERGKEWFRRPHRRRDLQFSEVWKISSSFSNAASTPSSTTPRGTCIMRPGGIRP
jgi:hypothetical protein